MHKKVEAVYCQETFLNNIYMLHPHSKKKVKVIAKTKPILLPPFITQKGRLTEEEKQKLLAAFEDAHQKVETRVLLEMIGLDGFKKITCE